MHKRLGWRRRRIGVRCSDYEWATITMAAKMLGMTITDYVMMCAVDDLWRSGVGQRLLAKRVDNTG